MARLTFALLLLAPLAGCGDLPASASKSEPTAPPPVGTLFNPAECGTITGRVTWEGKIPEPGQFGYLYPLPGGAFDHGYVPNPHDPRINAKEPHGVANAVVYLRGISPAHAKPWDLPEASVEMNDRSIRIRQGADLHLAGFARRGTPVAMVSKEPRFHNLRARGATYFSLAFPKPNEPLARSFDKPGLVHFTSGAGYFWTSAYLFVDEMSYFTRTDAEGRFTLTGVPAGPVEVIAWHPNRKFSRQERDPESCLLTRQTYGEPLQSSARAAVVRGEISTVNVTLQDR